MVPQVTLREFPSLITAGRRFPGRDIRPGELNVLFPESRICPKTERPKSPHRPVIGSHGSCFHGWTTGFGSELGEIRDKLDF